MEHKNRSGTRESTGEPIRRESGNWSRTSLSDAAHTRHLGITKRREGRTVIGLEVKECINVNWMVGAAAGEGVAVVHVRASLVEEATASQGAVGLRKTAGSLRLQQGVEGGVVQRVGADRGALVVAQGVGGEGAVGGVPRVGAPGASGSDLLHFLSEAVVRVVVVATRGRHVEGRGAAVGAHGLGGEVVVDVVAL